MISMADDLDLDDELFALAGGEDDNDVEEGEASSARASSPDSLGSGAMDESDSEHEEESPVRNSDVPYPLEGKYIDARDKAKILAMSQLERETVLGQRAEEMSRVNFQAEIARRAASMQNSNNRKRKADSDDESAGQDTRKTKKTNSSLEAYKRDREQRGQQRQNRDDDDRRRGRRRSSSADRDRHSDADAEGESDVDWDEERKPVVREEQPATLSHFEAVRVSRGFFSQVCFHPGFEEAMTGAFGRIGVGQDAQQRTLYKMAQIKGFTTGKPYAFDGKDGKRVGTDQYVICQYGTTKKEYQFQYLSNQRFTDYDLDAYKQSLAESGAKVPTQAFLKKKFDDIKSLENHHWTDADINARLARRNKFAHLVHKAASDNPAPKIPTQSELAAQRLAEINRQNRKAEQERIRKQQLEERQQKQMARRRAEQEARRKKQAEEEAKKAQEAAGSTTKDSLDVDALFDGDSSRATTPKPQEPKKTERKGLPTFRKPKMDDDIIASLDIGVDIEI